MKVRRERIKHNVMRMESEESPQFKNGVAFSFCIVSIRLLCVQSFQTLLYFSSYKCFSKKEKAEIQAPPTKIP